MWRELKYILSLAGCQAQVNFLFLSIYARDNVVTYVTWYYLQQQTIHHS